ncbi:hypothetical protein SAMN05443144_1124 [Fodinibius roseus]|uniref:Uncharacterized protein n=1 Tax=Fodinibius roseus TaxID=1194090 RepID=A0A1M5DR35_9BACT|nr:hypothetical protein SAMN05443144_1124 [Fodinibius roseus]
MVMYPRGKSSFNLSLSEGFYLQRGPLMPNVPAFSQNIFMKSHLTKTRAIIVMQEWKKSGRKELNQAESARIKA